MSFREEKELEGLETEIGKLEEQIADLTTQMNTGLSDHHTLFRVSQEIESLRGELDSKSIRWMELLELKEEYTK